jgi:hypothetical protein
MSSTHKYSLSTDHLLTMEGSPQLGLSVTDVNEVFHVLEVYQ